MIEFLLIGAIGYILYLEKPEMFEQKQGTTYDRKISNDNRIVSNSGLLDKGRNVSGCETKWTVRSINKKTGEVIDTCQGRLLVDGETTKILEKEEKWR